MKKILLGLLMTALLAGCATTEFDRIIFNVPSGTYYKKIIVHSDLADPSERKMIEEIVVHQLQTVGIEAVPSYVIFPPGTHISWDRKKQIIRADGFDACLLVKVVNSYSKTTPEMFINRTVIDISTAHFKIQTRIVETQNFTVVWQALSGSREGMADNGDFSVEGIIHSYASALVSEWQKEGIVVPMVNS